MATTMRRVRCFICDNLVFRRPSTSSPYSVKTLQIDNKRGCICSECVEKLYATYNTIFKAISGYSKRSNMHDNLPNPSKAPQRNTSTQNLAEIFLNTPPMQSPADILMNALKQMFPIPVVITSSKKEAITPTNKVSTKEKFACLNYSLDSYFSVVTDQVFGQDEAAKMLLYTIYFNQFANLLEEYGLSESIIRRSHVLLIGDTGVGKTFLTTTVANTLNIPYAFCNATSITSAGYIGGKVENFLEELYRNAGCNLELAENGILFIDEIDKKRVECNKSGRDVTGRAVQEELLKVLEASSIHLKTYNIDFNPKNLTVVMMGAFVGLDEIIDNRLNKKTIGFKTQNHSAEDANIIPDDLIEYGIIPEFIGRIPVIIKMNSLSKATVIDIIYSILNKFNIIFKVKNIDLIVDDLFIDSLADKIINSSTGARDVYSKVFNILSPALYQIFQSYNGGICQIDTLGNIELIVANVDNEPKLFHFDSSFDFEDEDY